MNSLFSATILIMLAFQIIGCQLQTSHETPDTGTSPNSTLVDPKYSLSKDRSEFDKLRENVPADTKKTNDEKALTAEWFAETKYDPEKIRDKYDTLVRKKRDLFNKDMTKAREIFNKEEQKKRAEFLKELELERKDFTGRKADRDKKNEFFNEQDEKRKNFMADQKDKREDFESDSREKRKNFEDYLKEKSNDFSSELKAYRLKWKDKNPN